MQRKLIISLILAILVAIFALQNSAEVVIKLWFWSAQTSLALVFILTFSAGAVVGLLFSITARKRKKKSDSSSDHTPDTTPGQTSPNSDEVPLEVNSPGDPPNNLRDDPEFEDVIN